MEFSDSLSELLANAGVLPMFGFPTRTRDLETEASGYGRTHKEATTRDIDIALSQFAPKAETVKDKKIYISVGIESEALKEESSVHKFKACPVCKHLEEIPQNVKFNKDNPDKCSVCGAKIKDYISAVQPEGFFAPSAIDSKLKPINYDGNFDYVPFAQKPQINHSEDIDLEHSSTGNYNYLKKSELTQIVAINDNSGKNYTLKLIADKNCKNLWLDVEAFNKYKQKYKETNNKDTIIYPPKTFEDEKTVALISAKETDIFLAEIDKIPEGIDLSVVSKRTEENDNIYSKIAYYSLAFMLRDSAANELDTNKREIVVGLRPIRKDGNDIVTNQIFLSDALDNGAGYCNWLCKEENFNNVLRSITEGEIYENLIKKTHLNNCDAACYECMQSYDNLPYHGLLNWRLGLDMARMISDKSFVPSLNEFYWKNVLDKAEKNFENIAKKHKDFIICHPLQKMEDTDNQINIFDILKRPAFVFNKIKRNRNK